jgi:hypothetical protein
MAGVKRRRRPRQKKKRHNIFGSMRKVCQNVGLLGNQQWAMALLIEQEGYRVSRCVYMGAEAARKALGVKDRANTKRRFHTMEDRYGLFTIVQGGGRRRGCSKDDIVGLTNRVYPGPMLMAEQVVARWIAEDNENELAKPGQWTYPPRRLELQRQVDEYRAGAELEESRAGP